MEDLITPFGGLHIAPAQGGQANNPFTSQQEPPPPPANPPPPPPQDAHHETPHVETPHPPHPPPPTPHDAHHETSQVNPHPPHPPLPPPQAYQDPHHGNPQGPSAPSHQPLQTHSHAQQAGRQAHLVPRRQQTYPPPPQQAPPPPPPSHPRQASHGSNAQLDARINRIQGAQRTYPQPSTGPHTDNTWSHNYQAHHNNVMAQHHGYHSQGVSYSQAQMTTHSHADQALNQALAVANGNLQKFPKFDGRTPWQAKLYADSMNDIAVQYNLHDEAYIRLFLSHFKQDTLNPALDWKAAIEDHLREYPGSLSAQELRTRFLDFHHLGDSCSTIFSQSFALNQPMRLGQRNNPTVRQ